MVHRERERNRSLYFGRDVSTIKPKMSPEQKSLERAGLGSHVPLKELQRWITSYQWRTSWASRWGHFWEKQDLPGAGGAAEAFVSAGVT